MGRAGGRYCSLEPFRETVTQNRALTIQPSWIVSLTVFGSEIYTDGHYDRDASPEHYKFGVRAYEVVQELLNRGLIKPHPVKKMPGGWEGVIQGVELIRQQATSGFKLVYSVA